MMFDDQLTWDKMSSELENVSMDYMINLNTEDEDFNDPGTIKRLRKDVEELMTSNLNYSNQN